MTEPGVEQAGLAHDPIWKAAMLKKSNDEMRMRIANLKTGLDQERSRLKDSHRHRIKEITDLKGEAEVWSRFPMMQSYFS